MNEPTQVPVSGRPTGGGEFAMPPDSRSNGAQPFSFSAPSAPPPQPPPTQIPPQAYTGQWQGSPGEFPMPPEQRAQPPEQQPQYQQPRPYTPPPTPQQDLFGPAGGAPYPQQPQYQQPAQQPQPQQRQYQPQPAYQPQPQYQQAPQYQQVQPSTAIRDRLISQGVNVAQYQTDEQLLADLGQVANQAQELQRWADYGRNQYQQAQQPAQQPAQQQATQAQQPQQPEWRDEWNRLVKFDAERQQFVATDPVAVAPMIVHRANELAEFRRRQAERLMANPAAAVWESGLDKRVQEEVERRLADRERVWQEQSRREQERATVVNLLTENRQRLFEHDANGQPVIVNQQGQWKMTDQGVAVARYSDQYRRDFQGRYGVDPDPTLTLQYAMTCMERDEARGAFQQQQVQQPPQYAQQPQYQQVPQQYHQPYPQQTNGNAGYGGRLAGYDPSQVAQQNAAMKSNTINRAIQADAAQQRPNWDGTYQNAQRHPNEIVQNPNLSLKQLFAQEAVRRGYISPDMAEMMG